jgi:tetratricopeptide (TPR) repeat protein
VLLFVQVKGLFTQKLELVSQIQSDRERRKKGDEPILFTVQGQSTSELNGEFVHSQIFIDVLLRIKPTQADRDEFISRCSKTYKENDSELAILKEFSRKYSPDRALWWYTRESFIYRMLNKALRVQNTDVLFLFRFFIVDLQQQLNNHRYTTPVRLYRGQIMSKDEVQVLKSSIKQFISINSFLSTSVDRFVALRFLNNDSDDFEQVLFEIDADPSVTTKPFADITKLSYFPREKEVLIMVGSIFQIVDVRDDDNGVWIIQMTLCSDDDHQLKVIFEHMKNEHGGGEKNLLSFGNVLADMGKFDEAEKYYLRLLKHLPPNDPDIARCYHGLGNVTDEKGDYDSSLEWHKKSLDLRTKVLKSDHPHLAPSYISIGCAHFNKDDYQQALASYNKAYDIIKKAFGDSHPDIAMCLNNIGCVYEREKNYSKALEYHKKALELRLEYLPEHHPDVGQSHHNIGNIYRCLSEYDLALKHYNDSLAIKKKSLPSQHRDIALTEENIGNIYKDQEQFQEALSSYTKAAVIYRHSLPPTHPSVLQIEEYIRYLS